MKRHTITTRFTLTTLALLGLVIPAAAAGPLPFLGSFQCAFTQPTPLSDNPPVVTVNAQGAGQATYLGQFTDQLQNLTINLATGAFAGSFDYTAANGDTVAGSVAGQLVPTGTPGVFRFTANAVITGGTGLFQAASGGFSITGMADFNTLTATVSFSGTISF
jgi:hypothetical protein